MLNNCTALTNSKDRTELRKISVVPQREFNILPGRASARLGHPRHLLPRAHQTEYLSATRISLSVCKPTEDAAFDNIGELNGINFIDQILRE